MNKYILIHGCHRGTLVSRDIASPEEFDDVVDAINQYKEHRKFYRSIGYQIWFASITKPDGEKYYLENNPYT